MDDIVVTAEEVEGWCARIQELETRIDLARRELSFLKAKFTAYTVLKDAVSEAEKP